MATKFTQVLVRYRILALILVVLMAVGGGALVFKDRLAGLFTPPSGTPQPLPLSNHSGSQPSGTGSVSPGGVGMTVEGTPMSIHLSQGQAQPHVAAPAAIATGEPLPPDEITQILSRLPELTPEPGDQTEFHLAGEPIPPPQPGETAQQSFPPPPETVPPTQVETGPLQVLRFSPEGEVPVAPFLSVTFNQPMVALATLDALAAEQVPVQIDPPLSGTWRWLGARTLTFQYDSDLIDRLPKATVYHATVPAGTRSATGGVLAEAVTWTFTTPPPKVISTYPPESIPQPLDPLFFIQFDQRIDPVAVLGTLKVTAGSRSFDLELVDEATVKKDKGLEWQLKNAVEGRWLAFRAIQPLPAGAGVTVTIGPGTPSAEGPLTTPESQSYGFSTYSPLKVEEHGCYWNNNECVPLIPLFIRFNNPLDTHQYDPSMVAIAPELPGASVDIIGNTLQIQGATVGQTTYTVTLSADLQDTFGQKLGQETRLTFKIGRAEPALYGTGGYFVTLDPTAPKPVFSVHSVNYTHLDLSIYAVQPSDWPAFMAYLEDFQRNNAPSQVPGRQVLNKSLPVEAASDALTEVEIDLSPYLDGPSGQFIISVAPPADEIRDKNAIPWQTVQTWVQVTQIGLDAFTDHSDMLVWATSLKDGAPLSGVTIEAGPGGQRFTTGEDGTARFPIPGGAVYLVARQGADQALLPRANYPWGNETWSSRPVSDTLRWYVFDDRQMYRPGEDVHIKGWLRRIGGTQTGDVGLLGEAVTSVSYQVLDSQNNVIGDGQADVNHLGGFDLAFTLPEKVNLGYTMLQLNPSGSLDNLESYSLQYTHSFQIQEFRRPEFEVTARNETTGPYFAGESATLAVKAAYYAGGALPDADVTWQVSSNPSQYSPPNWPGFTFGEWTPWWLYGGRMMMEKAYSAPAVEYRPGAYGGGTVETFTGKTDANGEHYLKLDFDKNGEPKPVSIVAQATVMDVNRQAWTGTTTLLVHPADLYVGLRSQRLFVDRGQPLKVDFIVTDLDGRAVPDRPVEVRLARLDWKYVDGEWKEVEADVQICQQGSTKEPLTCTFDTPLGGTYKITATVTDDQGRPNQSSLTRWVSGAQMPPQRILQQEQLTLVPDQETYQPGDVAHVLVISPFTPEKGASPAEGLLTLNRSGIVSTQRFQIQDGSATLDIPIEESMLPNLYLQVDVNGSAVRSDDQGNPLPDVANRPAFATGMLNLSISKETRTLKMEVTPAETELAPGGETTLDVAVKDAGGQPIPGAELAVVVVDEAILALSNYQAADPLETFYADRPPDLMSIFSRTNILLANPQALSNGHGGGGPGVRETYALDSAAGMAMPAAAATASPAQPTTTAEMAKGPDMQQANQPITLRTDFNPLAVFAPSVVTDQNGHASLPVKLPDNLTRYRVMVVAVEGGSRFGAGEANLTARLPLMVRPSAPRFLNFGDRFELPVVLQNQTGEDMVVDVAVRASNLELVDHTGLRVTVPARDRVEVRFPATTQMAGTARLQIAAVSGSYADAATVELPVYTPATTEAFATYGVIDSGAVAQPIASPTGVYTQFGGLEITTSSTALQALTDAVLYLVSYPYDCTEQIASRMLAISALKDVLTAFQAEGLPSPEAMQASVSSDIQMLKGLQNDDGGFPYWRRGQDSIPFNSIHVAHALAMAKVKGFDVPADLQQRLLEHLRQIEAYYPSWYDQQTRQTLSAYALYVRHLMGDSDPAKALKLVDQAGVEGLSLDAIGWLWPVLRDSSDAAGRLEEIRRFVNNRAVETPGAANFTNEYTDQNYLLLGSDRRTDAILLSALIEDNPHSDLIVKVVNGLLAHRTKGRWGNTQENVFVLLALDKYFNTFETQTPDFVARIWLGETYAGSQEFRGYSAERNQLDIPMSYLVDSMAGTQDLILSKEGPGRLYYRLGLSYAPVNLTLEALDMGFVVQRSYEAVDNPDDVSQDENGVWHIKTGSRVRVHLTLEADNRRYHVALVDPMPAGLEAVNPDLAVSGTLPPDPEQPGSKLFWWWGPWYQHQNLRDERAEAFTSLLWEGVYQYTYIARATTPGIYVVPPAKAEEMYSPEVFGRSASDKVVVE